MTAPRRRLQCWERLVIGHGSPFGLALLLTLLAGCNPAENSLWPSIEPVGNSTLSSRASATPAEPPSAGLLPTNPWELAGGLGLMLGVGGLAVLVWKGSTVQRRVDALQSSAESLARRRDSGTADLVHLSRQVNALNQQVLSLKAELVERPAVATAPTTASLPAPVPAPAAPRFNAPASPRPAAPKPALATNVVEIPEFARVPAPAPVVPPAPAAVAAAGASAPQPQAVSLPPLSPPPATPSAPAPPPPPAFAQIPPAPPPPAPEPVLARALDVLRQATFEPAPEPMPQPMAEPMPESVAQPVAKPFAPPAGPDPALSGITLQDLIDAVNGRGNRQIEGIHFAQLDPAEFTTLDGIGRPQAPRLRLVGSGGRFLMVFFEDESWLFPAVTTLEAYSHDHSETGFFGFEQAAVSCVELCRPALLREAGGLWEVTEPGTILVPTL
jgi:hypothetical protein